MSTVMYQPWIAKTSNSGAGFKHSDRPMANKDKLMTKKRWETPSDLAGGSNNVTGLHVIRRIGMSIFESSLHICKHMRISMSHNGIPTIGSWPDG
jgi:hypothetical protein